jgi:hypothetical protein
MSKSRSRARHAAVLLAAALAAGLVPSAHAQATSTSTLAASPVIDGLEINADAGLRAGSTLDIAVRGTPGGQAIVLLPGDGPMVRLHETDPGVYVGSYTVREADRIDAQGPIRASVAQGARSTIAGYLFPPSFREVDTADVAPAVPITGSTAAPGPVQPTAVMGATAATAAPLVLQVTPPSVTTVDDRNGVAVEGRTAPDAFVRVRVDTVPPAAPGRASVARTVMEETVQADADGRFRIDVGPQRVAPGTHVEIALQATQGEQSTPEQRLVIVQGAGQD